MARLTDCVDLITFVLAACLEQRSTRRADASSTESTDSFDASHSPIASTLDFVTRVVESTGASSCVFVTALVYIQRLKERAPHHAPTPKSVQNLFLTAVVLAIKFHEDVFFSNSFYASLGGMSVEELNKKELLFLSSIDFNLYVSETEFVFAEHMVVTDACESCIGPALAPHLERAGLWIPKASRLNVNWSVPSPSAPFVSTIYGNSPFASSYFKKVARRLAGQTASDESDDVDRAVVRRGGSLWTPDLSGTSGMSVAPAFNSFDGVYMAPCAEPELHDVEDEESYECHAVRMLDLEYCATTAF